MSKEICRAVHTASGYCGLKIHPGGQDWSSSSSEQLCQDPNLQVQLGSSEISRGFHSSPVCRWKHGRDHLFTKDTHFQMKPWPTFSSASLTPIPPSQWPTLRPPRYSYYCFFVPGTIFPLNRWWSQWMNMNRSTHEWSMYIFSLNLQNVLGNEFISIKRKNWSILVDIDLSFYIWSHHESDSHAYDQWSVEMWNMPPN